MTIEKSIHLRRGRSAARRRNIRPIMATVLAACALLASSVIVAPLASADCQAINEYQLDPAAGHWDQYEVLLVPPSSGTVEQTITTTRTLSSTSTVGSEVGGSVKTVLAEVNAKLHASYAETVTIEAGRSTKMTAPPSTKNQEIRYGTFIDHISYTTNYYGCGSAGDHAPYAGGYVLAAKPAAGIVVVA
ncbi:MAG: hypothetical protein H0V92_08105 [Pseudonocardiales bacterium]|nr:hypothetical protein [Pseudonocardiales bacterium]